MMAKTDPIAETLCKIHNTIKPALSQTLENRCSTAHRCLSTRRWYMPSEYAPENIHEHCGVGTKLAKQVKHIWQRSGPNCCTLIDETVVTKSVCSATCISGRWTTGCTTSIARRMQTLMMPAEVSCSHMSVGWCSRRTLKSRRKESLLTWAIWRQTPSSCGRRGKLA